jgi:hypothetical protein
MTTARAIAFLIVFRTAWSIAPGTIAADSPPLFKYTLSRKGDAASYDEALAATSMQGIINHRSSAPISRHSARLGASRHSRSLIHNRPEGYLSFTGTDRSGPELAKSLGRWFVPHSERAEQEKHDA